MSGPGDTPEIRALDPATIDQIAAGEVVERPASVVKELVENAIDAGASRITVEVEGGGTDRIRVVDDGVGMNESAVRRAVEPHTTSKLRSIEDLTSGIETLGFRGEALHTIGAVSRMAITTKSRGDDGSGTKLVMESGTVDSVEPTGCPPGTAVEVTDLFATTPARKKFLKQETTEFDHVNRIVTQYSLANPDIAMTLEHNDRTIFRTTGQGDLESAVLAVYGREVADSLISLEPASLSEGPIEDIAGAVSDPETTRSAARYVSTYVNGRAVRSATIREAIVQAYGHHLANDRYPFAIVFLTLPPDSVDVNVHPRKLEVRIDEEETVRRQLRQAIEARLRATEILRSSAPRGRSAPTETRIEPSDEEPTDPTIAARADASEAIPSRTRTRRQGADGSSSGSAEGPSVSSRSETTTESSSEESTGSADGDIQSGDGSLAESTQNPTPTERAETTRRDFSHPGRQSRFDGSPTDELERLPSIDILGQVADTYIVGEHDRGVVLVDQHAADERIHFERLRERFRGDVTTQALMEPVNVEVTAGEAAIFDEVRPALEQLGFSASRTDRTIAVRSVPTVLGESLEPDLLRDVLQSFVAGEPQETIDATAEALLADLACYPAITGNRSLTDGSVRRLLETLDSCEEPFACPHGRPTVITIPWDEIEDRFERDYPGHQRRRPE